MITWQGIAIGIVVGIVLTLYGVALACRLMGAAERQDGGKGD